MTDDATRYCGHCGTDIGSDIGSRCPSCGRIARLPGWAWSLFALGLGGFTGTFLFGSGASATAAVLTAIASAWLFSVFLRIIRTNPRALRPGRVSAQGVVAIVALVEALSVVGVARVTVCGETVESSEVVRAVVALLVLPALITPFVVLSFRRRWGRAGNAATCAVCGTLASGTSYCSICGARAHT